MMIGFGFPGFSLFSIFFAIIFILIICVFAAVIILSLTRYFKNNRQPVIPVSAVVATKRISVSENMHNAGDMNTMHTSTTFYYATFEFANGERLELAVDGQQYGLLREGDKGTLYFQGTRFISFTRDKG